MVQEQNTDCSTACASKLRGHAKLVLMPIADSLVSTALGLDAVVVVLRGGLIGLPLNL